MTVRSDVLILDSRTYVATAATTILTVPSGELWIIKDLALYDGDIAVDTTFRMSLFRSSVEYPFLVRSLIHRVTQDISGRFLCAEAGDEIRGNSSAAVNVRVYASGARLVVP